MTTIETTRPVASIAGDARSVVALSLLLQQRKASATAEDLIRWDTSPVLRCICGAQYRQVRLDIFPDGTATVTSQPTRLFCKAACRRRQLMRERRREKTRERHETRVAVIAGKPQAPGLDELDDDTDDGAVIGLSWFVAQRDRAARALSATLTELRLSFHDYAALRKRDPIAAAFLVEERWTDWLKQLAKAEGSLLESLGGNAPRKKSRKTGATTAC